MKYSKQRDIIYKTVQECLEHPTVHMIYTKVRSEIPNISLGTVYRNLNALAEENMIRKIKMPDDSERFDKTLMNHFHFYCTNCNKVFDIDKDILEEIIKITETSTNYKITSSDIVFKGICHNCREED